MKQYSSKKELISEINKAFEKYITEFFTIREEDKNLRIDGVDRTPAENLSYQLGWTTLLLQWERDELIGKIVKTPHPNFKWNELGKLYSWFYEQYSKMTLEELIIALTNNVNEIIVWLENISDEELFMPHKRKWADSATKTAVWPIWKFVQVNTVAPFKTFRTKIRKWKKER
ncbi:hypothetical protein HMPREF1983_00602 [Gemella bergeri ATCC 700627]|uniref:ClbS/DfsB family four-helix bundle protein n=1 Tax=Gemella bergeri ATCC 700627 TaxID=1321820 RepID=U2S8T9_9BACL|nr:ClbS/DfsB family four-helix bundle protein [Gemella bergeri]ERK59227.1 hypothetical protein HMPREF1983_00602 [Gemella bergeri ATCC 700627]